MECRGRWTCHSARSSFGLKPEDKKYILEEIFLLMEYCHFSWEECWSLPIEYRRWFLDRKNKENEKIKEAREKAKKKVPTPPMQKSGSRRVPPGR